MLSLARPSPIIEDIKKFPRNVFQAILSRITNNATKWDTYTIITQILPWPKWLRMLTNLGKGNILFIIAVAKPNITSLCVKLSNLRWSSQLYHKKIKPRISAKTSISPRVAYRLYGGVLELDITLDAIQWWRGRARIFFPIRSTQQWIASKASLFWLGSSTYLRALEALTFLTIKYAFSDFSWQHFLQNFPLTFIYM